MVGVAAISLENPRSNPPCPLFLKGGKLISPFYKGGIRGIIFIILCEPWLMRVSSENPVLYVVVATFRLRPHGTQAEACGYLMISLPFMSLRGVRPLLHPDKEHQHRWDDKDCKYRGQGEPAENNAPQPPVEL